MSDLHGQKLAYPIGEGIQILGETRTSAYKAIAAGDLKTFKIGRRRMVTRRALEEYVALRERQSQGRAA